MNRGKREIRLKEHQLAKAMEAGGDKSINFCMRCGEYLKDGSLKCPKCGYTYGQAYAATKIPVTQLPHRPSWASLNRAGILFLFAGLDGVVSTIYAYLNRDVMIAQYANLTGLPIGDVQSVIYFALAATLICSALALVASYFSWKHKRFLFAAVAGVFAVFTSGFYLEASICAVIGLIMVYSARSQFQN